MSWFYLALLAAFLYAVVNLLDDNLLRFVYKSPYLATFSAGIYGLLPLLTMFFIHASNIPASLALLSAGAGFLTLTCYFFYFKGLGSESPSIVVALFSLAPAAIPFFAHFLVHERLTSVEVLGFMVVLLASLSLAVTNLRQLKFSKALVPVSLSIVLLVAVSIMTKYVYQRAAFYPAYLYFSVGMGLAGILFLSLKFEENKKTIRDIAKSIKRLLPIFIIAELLGLAAEFMGNFAISRGPVSLVEVIDGIQPMFVLLVALALFPYAPKYFREAKEGRVARKLVPMCVALVGLAMIGASSII